LSKPQSHVQAKVGCDFINSVGKINYYRYVAINSWLSEKRGVREQLIFYCGKVDSGPQICEKFSLTA